MIEVLRQNGSTHPNKNFLLCKKSPRNLLEIGRLILKFFISARSESQYLLYH